MNLPFFQKDRSAGPEFGITMNRQRDRIQEAFQTVAFCAPGLPWMLDDPSALGLIGTLEPFGEGLRGGSLGLISVSQFPCGNRLKLIKFKKPRVPLEIL
jgi:hypothetical protein